MGCSSWSRWRGSTSSTASSLVSRPSLNMSVATLSAAAPVRLPLRVCSMYSLPSCTVNSMSCMSFMWRSRPVVMASSSLYVSGKRSAIILIGTGVRVPATTSSPCAFIRNSPNSSCVPLAGLRVKHTPVPLLSLMLPYTMVWMLTAVPFRPVILLISRYFCARGMFQERKTASMPMASCCQGSAGSVLPAFLYTALYWSTRPLRSSAVSCTSNCTPRTLLSPVRQCSKSSLGMPSTTSPNICSRRR
mmetsp:Transcript_14325/g.35472  ORF Transcript_14325/g.35472 Transcript_14325/m.35472 type:complete len:246 (+) Transcript_14325:2367-3104(+)